MNDLPSPTPPEDVPPPRNPDFPPPRFTDPGKALVPPRYRAGGPSGPQKPGSTWKVVLTLLVALMVFIFCILFLGSLFSFKPDRREIGFAAGGRIGLVRIEGIITQSRDKEFWMKSLHDLADSSGVRGVVIWINSPGGAVATSQELAQAVAEIRERRHKPVYAAMGDVAASGGYYIAAAADRIFAMKGTLTGSIGVIFAKPQISELARKIGFETEIVKSGRFKDAGSITRPMTDPERELFNALIQNTYRQFVDDVLEHRAKPIERAMQEFTDDQWTSYLLQRPAEITARTFLEAVADGRVYTGQQAAELGLIDEIGSLDDAVRAMADTLGIKGRPEIYEPKPKVTFRELFDVRIDRVLPSAGGTLQYLMLLP